MASCMLTHTHSHTLLRDSAGYHTPPDCYGLLMENTQTSQDADNPANTSPVLRTVVVVVYVFLSLSLSFFISKFPALLRCFGRD